MISVVISTRNHGAVLPETLAALVPAALDGMVREVIVADGGSVDATRLIADGFGADVLELADACPAARLNAGAQAAKCAWVLFVPPVARLRPGFEKEVALFAQTSRQPAARLHVHEPTFVLRAKLQLQRLLSSAISDRDCLLVRRAVITRAGSGFKSAPGGRASLHIVGGARALTSVAEIAVEPSDGHAWLWVRRTAGAGTSVTQTSAN